jgi:DNA modification methylase
LNAPEPYRQFLEAKVKLASQDGFHVDLSEINPALKPHVRVAVQWACSGGCRAFFARFGMQKTTWHLETMRLVAKHTSRPVLIVVPLGARLSFFNDAEKYFTGACAIKLKFVQSSAEVDPGAINITNTESVREGKIDPKLFAGTTFDEGDILRNQSSKTFWEFVRNWTDIKFRFVATATPDPQDYTELLAYASYLGIMDIGQARTRFFKRNSEKADELTLHPHKEREFWLWVASWALFLYRPSDLGDEFSDEGYILPDLDIRWHEVPSDHSKAAPEASGQGVLLKNAALGVKEASSEKRDSIPARIAKLQDIRTELPTAHRLIWHDLNDERDAIKKAVPDIAVVTGAMDLEKREITLMDFARGAIKEMAGKPSMIGSGGNYQAYCWHAVFLGVGYKFKDFIQAIHRIQRYGQGFVNFQGRERRVRIDIIATEAERAIVEKLKERWRRYDEQAARMSALMREYGLAKTSLGLALTRSMGAERRETKGERFTIVNNDCVDETRRMESSSVGLILSSLPFSTQYEYTPSYNDFGHTDDDAHFFEQMDFLTPNLLRVLKPGRIAAIHCKDRIVEGSRTGLGFQTVEPFADKVKAHFIKHGFAYLGTKYIATDVVRENAQSYRLGWTEQCKDGSRMGVGLVEYLHLFRKPQTDRSRGYADEPVVKSKEEYTIGRWQPDAGGFTRSSGNRLLTPAELAMLPPKGIFARYKEHSRSTVYDIEHHVACNDALRAADKLFPDFCITPVQSWHPDVWTDITRMRTLNTIAAQKSREKHLCPLQFDIVERVIRQMSNKDDIVLDMFGGLMTVPFCAIKMGRRGYGIDLSADYCRDGITYCREAEEKALVPTLFDLIEAEKESDLADDAVDIPAFLPKPRLAPAVSSAVIGKHGATSGEVHDAPLTGQDGGASIISPTPDRAFRNAVSNKPGEVESAIPGGAHPNSNPGCAPSFSGGFPELELPELLRRKRDAA